MFEYLEKLRKRSREERRRFVLIFTSSLTGVVVLVWLITMPITYAPITKKEVKEDAASPWRSIREGVANVRNAFRSEWQYVSEDIGKFEAAVASSSVDR